MDPLLFGLIFVIAGLAGMLMRDLR